MGPICRFPEAYDSAAGPMANGSWLSAGGESRQGERSGTDTGDKHGRRGEKLMASRKVSRGVLAGDVCVSSNVYFFDA